MLQIQIGIIFFPQKVILKKWIYTDEIGVVALLFELIVFLFIDGFDGVADVAVVGVATVVTDVEQIISCCGVWITSLILA